nr:unnamed protein product [Callosobruchus chinensis]
MPGLLVGDQVLQPDVHPVPLDAGGDDRYQEIIGLRLHSERIEDTGRSDAGHDQTQG